jgi:hypothetical protein
MSNYHHSEFLGFATSAPPNIVPDWLFEALFFPPIKTRDGIPVEAPYRLRKIEAQLMKEGFDVLTADPDHHGPYIEEAKVLAVHTMSRLKNRDRFRVEAMNDLHRKLPVKCLKHGFYWVKIIMRSYLRGKWYRPLLSPLYKLIIWLIERSPRQYSTERL